LCKFLEKMGLPETKYITEKEYLDAERLATEKHEYFQGEIFAMSGASRAHNEIFSNAFGEFVMQLKGKTCRPYGSDFRVNIPQNTLYTYPDISVFCNEPETLDAENDTATNPSVIVEILSKTTRNYDQGEKFALYRQIESLKEYILIDSLNVKVIKHTKMTDGSWLLVEYNAIENSFYISSIGVTLNLVDLYENVKFI
jgi:Uma2 family endonuclease